MHSVCACSCTHPFYGASSKMSNVSAGSSHNDAVLTFNVSSSCYIYVATGKRLLGKADQSRCRPTRNAVLCPIQTNAAAALYSPSLLMATHRRIYSNASISINSRPSFCGYTNLLVKYGGIRRFIRDDSIVGDFTRNRNIRCRPHSLTRSLTCVILARSINTVNSLFCAYPVYIFRFVYVLYTLRYSADMHRQPVLPADETVISVTQPCTY